MATQVTEYGDISPRTAAFVVKDLLKRSMPYLVFEKFGQAKPLPKNSTQAMKFRRYFLDAGFTDENKWNPAEYIASSNFDPSSFELTEGETPDGSILSSEDIQVQLTQYGNRVTITDVIQDTHEDSVLKEAIDIMSEQASLLLENVRFSKLSQGSNVDYANGSARNDVNTPISLDQQRRIVRSLKRNMGKPITNVVRSTPAYDTQAIAPAYIAICHPDLEPDIRSMDGFTPSEKYGQMSPFETELGKVEDVRYLTSPVITPWEDDGGDAGDMISTSGTKADVYPIFYLAKNAYAITPLKGMNAIKPIVLNPGTPSKSDPLGQRGYVSWKAWQSAVILNDAWMVRAEVAATD